MGGHEREKEVTVREEKAQWHDKTTRKEGKKVPDVKVAKSSRSRNDNKAEDRIQKWET